MKNNKKDKVVKTLPKQIQSGTVDANAGRGLNYNFLVLPPDEREARENF